MSSPFVFKNIIIRKISYDPEAIALFNRMTTQPSSSRKLLISNFFKGLKSDLQILSLSSYFDAIWFFAAHENQAARLNWVKNSHNITEVNTPTWSNTGYISNGTTSYLNTNFIASTNGISYTLNSCHIAVYSRTNVTESSYEIGNNDLSNALQLGIKQVTDISFTNLNTGFGDSLSNTNDSTGLFQSNRSSSTNINIYRSGISLGTITRSSVAMPTQNIYVLARNLNNAADSFSTKEIGFASIGASINQTILNNRVREFLSSIGAL